MTKLSALNSYICHLLLKQVTYYGLKWITWNLPIKYPIYQTKTPPFHDKTAHIYAIYCHSLRSLLWRLHYSPSLNLKTPCFLPANALVWLLLANAIKQRRRPSQRITTRLKRAYSHPVSMLKNALFNRHKKSVLEWGSSTLKYIMWSLIISTSDLLMTYYGINGAIWRTMHTKYHSK